MGLLEANVTSAFRVSDKIKFRLEMDRLEDLQFMLRAISMRQSQWVSNLERFADGLATFHADPSSKENPMLSLQIRYEIVNLGAAVSHLRDHLAEVHSKHLDRDPVLFDNLDRVLAKRRELFQELHSLIDGKATFSEDETSIVRKIIADYKRLMELLQGYRQLVGNISESLERKSKE
jgi:hypothetical protein